MSSGIGGMLEKAKISKEMCQGGDQYSAAARLPDCDVEGVVASSQVTKVDLGQFFYLVTN